MDPILDVQNLVVKFNTLEGVVNAVNGVSFTVESGKTLGIVGESGCGKSVSVLSVMGLIPDPPGKISKGRILFKNKDLLTFENREMESIRGARIGMVFQDPMTSLNPVLTIGSQISEAMISSLRMKPTLRWMYQFKPRSLNLPRTFKVRWGWPSSGLPMTWG